MTKPTIEIKGFKTIDDGLNWLKEQKEKPQAINELDNKEQIQLYIKEVNNFYNNKLLQMSNFKRDEFFKYFDKLTKIEQYTFKTMIYEKQDVADKMIKSIQWLRFKYDSKKKMMNIEFTHEE